ncbi:hypothetical protein [Candidatus Thiosymbion oneisti]|uniref:hypothetical protein n=1 Tax=Candidatus Thiosymbion oneisti TaxID=589554 RepID=UPI00105C97D9|nr:hypothetical protein [Candidatus Thiosymbion oneisti]
MSVLKFLGFMIVFFSTFTFAQDKVEIKAVLGEQLDFNRLNDFFSGKSNRRSEKKLIVYFFDTSSCSLNDKGLILRARIRQGDSFLEGKMESTVKIRTDNLQDIPGFECEKDLLPNKRELFSCSLKTKVPFSEGLRPTGSFAFWSDQQLGKVEKMMDQSLSQLSLQSYGPIKATKYKYKGIEKIDIKSLTLEIWEVNGDQLYELSTKVPESKSDRAQEEMNDLLKKMDIKSSALTKTRWALSKLGACYQPDPD